MHQTEKGCLYIVATPIGNLDDITRRAASVLADVDAIAAEDTRRSRKLLQHLGIDTPLFALHEHNEDAKTAAVIERLQQGESIALISDAGTPLISDPGYTLVKQAHAAEIRVVPVPGPSSILAALSCAGLATDRFVFEGFLPAKSGTRRNQLKSLNSEQRTLVFFEAPHRIEESLQDMLEIFGPERQVVLARELTKTYETLLTGDLATVAAAVAADANQTLGEMVVVLAGAESSHADADEESMHILTALCEELPLKQAAALAAKITGKGRNMFYQAGLELKKNAD